MKKIIIILGLIVAIVAAGLAYLLSSLDSIVANAITTFGTQITRVNVDVDKVTISTTSGEGSVQGLTVANPSGFKTARALSLGAISMKLDTESMTSKTVTINEILINAPEVTYEIGADGSNIATIQKNVETSLALLKGDDKGAGSTAQDDSSGPKFIIKKFVVSGGKVNVSASLMQGKTLTTKLPVIQLTDIGKKSGGATAAEIAKIITDAIAKSAGGAAGALDLSALGLQDITGALLKDAPAATKAIVDEVVKGAGDGTGALGAATGDLLKGTGDKVGGAVDGAIKGLFGK